MKNYTATLVKGDIYLYNDKTQKQFIDFSLGLPIAVDEKLANYLLDIHDVVTYQSPNGDKEHTKAFKFKIKKYKTEKDALAIEKEEQRKYAEFLKEKNVGQHKINNQMNEIEEIGDEDEDLEEGQDIKP